MKKCILKSDKKTAEWYEQEIKKIEAGITDLKIARPALRALINASIYSVKTLRTKSIDELQTLHGMGPAAIKKLKTLLQ